MPFKMTPRALPLADKIKQKYSASLCDCSGYTLFEMLLVIAIVAIMMGFGISGYISWMDRTKTDEVANDLTRSITQARGESLRYGGKVVLCGSSTGEACENRWNEGWIVFLDQDQSETYDNGETLIANQRIQGSDPEITVNHLETNAALQAITFNHRGFLNSPLELHISNQSFEKRYQVSRTGYIQ